MNLSEKRQLVRLLNVYQDEMIGDVINNKQESENMRLQNKNKWEGDIKLGCKSQFQHARVITAKLSNEINKEMPSYWDL